MNSNMRLLWYNGLKTCQSYDVLKDVLAAGQYATQPLSTGLKVYPQVGNYWFGQGLGNMTPLQDMMFGRPAEYYFNQLQAHDECPKAYEMYYRSQVTDITSPNASFLDVEIHLNESDIDSLDLKTPVFLDLGFHGYGYFKVLSVAYQNSGKTSTVSLQKII